MTERGEPVVVAGLWEVDVFSFRDVRAARRRAIARTASVIGDAAEEVLREEAKRIWRQFSGEGRNR